MIIHTFFCSDVPLTVILINLFPKCLLTIDFIDDFNDDHNDDDDIDDDQLIMMFEAHQTTLCSFIPKWECLKLTNIMFYGSQNVIPFYKL